MGNLRAALVFLTAILIAAGILYAVSSDSCGAHARLYGEKGCVEP